MNDSRTTIGISGASGFIGSHLSQWFSNLGYRIIPLNRDLFTEHSNLLAGVVSKCDVVINLAGAPINKRWSAKYKKILYHSRIDITRMLVNAINSNLRTKLFISTSAVGYYPTNQGCYDEEFTSGSTSFLGQLCTAWEAETKNIRKDIRLVITRFGIVFAPDGGVFEKISSTYKHGVGVAIGRQTNLVSWIDIEDLQRIMQLIIENNKINGIYNLTTPEPAMWGDIHGMLAKHYKVKFSINIPSWILKLALGQSSTLLTDSVCVRPKKLVDLGYKFHITTFEEFISKRL